MPSLQRIAPEFPVSDVSKSIEHYVARLGFRLVMTAPDGDYAVVERDDVAIHLFRASKQNTPVSIHIFTEGLEELFAEFERRGTQIVQGIARKPWGNRDFRVRDDSGNEIKFTEPLQED